ncbi:MAG: DUF2079 domain-containing protein [Ruminococcus sp.]|nr:DUF2079 domain-containing protein [Ruminococcus sp.]
MNSEKITNETDIQSFSENAATEISAEAEAVQEISDAPAETTEVTADSVNAAEGETQENAGEPEKKKKFSIKRAIDFIVKMDYPNIFMLFIGSYLFTMAYFVFDLKKEINPVDKWQDFIKEISLVKFTAIFLILVMFVGVLHVLLKKKTNVSAAFLLGGALSLSLIYLWKSENYYYCMAFIVLSGVAAWFCYNYGGFRFLERLPKKGIYAIIILMTIFMAAFISFFTICKHLVYWTATFDFGIFLQMYHYMAETFEPLTTCERDKLLSHYAVHFSPIYYVLLPFYYLFPSANTLFISQGILAAIGAIPLMLICRHRKFSNLETLSFAVVYLFCTAIVAPCFYDFHENAFLPPLLMWFFYAIEKRKTVLMYVFMLLLLIVKEDVALYVALIGYYCIFALEKKRHGAIIFSFSAIYFVVVTGLMTKFGEGVMTSRTYGNLMADHSKGLGEVVKTVLMNPVYFLTQCINEEKFIFFLMMLLPLAFLPLVSKKLHNYFLAAPFILMNLASGYFYAKEIGFQYVFGTSTCLIYCALINYNDIKAKNKQFVPVFMSVATLCTFSTMIGGKTNAFDVYRNDKERFQTRDALLDTIPDDASVAGFDSFLIAHIAQRDELYLLNDGYLNKPIEYDFVIFKEGYEDQWLIDYEAKVIENGYQVFNPEDTSDMIIYISPEYKGVD